MTGMKTGVKARLSKSIPGIICITCPAHKTHLAAKRAMQILPSEVKDFVSNVYTMVNSSKNLHNICVIQKEKNIALHKIFRMIEVRWLQAEMCIQRIREQWDSVWELVFGLQGEAKGNVVFQSMKKKEIWCFILLLENVLLKLNALNLFF